MGRTLSLPGMARHLMQTVVDEGEDLRPSDAAALIEVSRVPTEATETDVRCALEPSGAVEWVTEVAGQETRTLRVRFVEPAAADAACAAETQICGKSVDVQRPVRRTSLLQGRFAVLCSSVLNLLNAIVGSGTLGLGYIMQGSGIGFFLLLLAVMVCIIDYSLQLLIAAAATTKVKGQMVSYERLGSLAWGDKGVILVSGMILLQNSGAMVTYFKVFKDIIPDIMKLVASKDSLWCNSDFMTSIAAAVVFLPACSSKIGFLSYVGAVAIFLTVFFVFFVVLKSTTLSQEDTCAVQVKNQTYDYSDCKLEYFHPTVETFLALPTICFSFVCHTSVLPVYHELQLADDIGRTRRSHKRIMRVIHTSLFVAFLLYSFAAFFGYYTFRGNTKKDLLQNYGDLDDLPGHTADPFSVTVRLLFMVAVVMSIPLLIFPYRRSLDFLWEAVQRLRDREPEGERTGFDFWWRHVLKTAVIVGVMLLGALFVPQITTVFGAVGATSSVSLVFLLPSALYMKLCLGEENLSSIQRRGSQLDRQLASERNTARGHTQDPEKQTLITREGGVLELPPLAVNGPKIVFCLGCCIFLVSWSGLIYMWSTQGSGD